MKTRILLILLSCALFAIAAFAQQNSSSANMQSTGATSSSTDDSVREPLTWPRAQNWWDGDDPNVVNLVTHPFARKPWIKRQLGPIRDRINELDEITAANASHIKDIDSRSQQGIQLASEKADLANQHAADASSQAQAAQTAATEASARVTNAEQLVNNVDQYRGDAQTEIRFRPGQSVLSKQAKDALDQMAAPLKGQHSYILEIHGFAPGHGQAAITASQKMADSVVRYLVETDQIPIYRIFVLGMGNASIAGEQGTKHASARVEVSVLKSDVVSTAQR